MAKRSVGSSTPSIRSRHFRDGSSPLKVFRSRFRAAIRRFPSITTRRCCPSSSSVMQRTASCSQNPLSRKDVANSSRDQSRMRSYISCWGSSGASTACPRRGFLGSRKISESGACSMVPAIYLVPVTLGRGFGGWLLVISAPQAFRRLVEFIQSNAGKSIEKTHHTHHPLHNSTSTFDRVSVHLRVLLHGELLLSGVGLRMRSTKRPRHGRAPRGPSKTRKREAGFVSHVGGKLVVSGSSRLSGQEPSLDPSPDR